MSIELRIKSKHLAEEARIIKFEEARQKKFGNYETLNRLCEHRKIDVRNENRATFLARAYIAGKPYRSCEHKRRPEKEYQFKRVLRRVLAMVQKYHDRKTSEEDIINWIK